MKFTPKELTHGLKFDLHIHTQFSDDSLINIKNLAVTAKKKGLAGIAITDHNTLNGYKYFKKNCDIEELLVIPGMEIETNIGEVIGLFISEEINTRINNYQEIIDDIKDKNGIVVVPHPFDRFRSNHLKLEYLSDETIRKTINGVEIVNSRIIRKKDIFKALEFQQHFDFFKTGGSDAHTIGEIGNGYTFIPTEEDTEAFTMNELKKNLLLKKSESYGKQSNPLVHGFTVLTKLKNKLFK
ncbi:MAG: PHP domain-containing protein [Promethearchaeota archaeon]